MSELLARLQIEYLNTIPSYYALNGYKVWPDWDPLRPSPRFRRVLASETR